MVLISWSRRRPPNPAHVVRELVSQILPQTRRVTERGPERAERERADKGPLSRAWSSCPRALPALVPASERVSPLNMHTRLSRSRETHVGRRQLERPHQSLKPCDPGDPGSPAAEQEGPLPRHGIGEIPRAQLGEWGLQPAARLWGLSGAPHPSVCLKPLGCSQLLMGSSMSLARGAGVSRSMNESAAALVGLVMCRWGDRAPCGPTCCGDRRQRPELQRK